MLDNNTKRNVCLLLLKIIVFTFCIWLSKVISFWISGILCGSLERLIFLAISSGGNSNGFWTSPLFHILSPGIDFVQRMETTFHQEKLYSFLEWCCSELIKMFTGSFCHIHDGTYSFIFLLKYMLWCVMTTRPRSGILNQHTDNDCTIMWILWLSWCFPPSAAFWLHR